MTGDRFEFRFVGEHLALDFVNTRTTERDLAREDLATYRQAIAWFAKSGILSRTDATALLRLEGSRDARETLRALHDFRDDVRALLDDYRRSGRVATRYLELVNARLADCGCRRALVLDGDRFVVRVQYRFERAHDLLMPLANAVAELLAQEDLTRLKRCGGDCCDMYFLDVSRNRSRTWCDMAACGNRAKAAAYYRRSRAEGAA
mgnify:CR=1 FL=1